MHSDDWLLIYELLDQRTNGPVNAHLRSAILTKYLFKKFPLYGAPPTNQNKGLGLSQPNCRALLYKHFCKNRIQISAIGPEKIANFHFSRFKSIETLSCHSNQISYPTEIKNTNYVETIVRNMHTKYRLHAVDNV